jgi:hypothetical protein
MRERLSRTFGEIVASFCICFTTLVLAFRSFWTFVGGEFGSELDSGGGVVPAVL